MKSEIPNLEVTQILNYLADLGLDGLKPENREQRVGEK